MSRVRLMVLAAVAALMTGLLVGGAPAATAATAEGAPAVSQVRGVVVNAANGRPLRGVTVVVRDALNETWLGSDATDVNGRFVVSNRSVVLEDVAVFVNGRARGFEAGYLTCSRTVVRYFADACTHGPGWIGRARLDRLP